MVHNNYLMNYFLFHIFDLLSHLCLIHNNYQIHFYQIHFYLIYYIHNHNNHNIHHNNFLYCLLI
ncbi:hypothetical protein HERIO_1519 [Hepatospora eriocheir]|uniref:Uncharacterized protein n=1 Tax=Hepatospora eriocheir TaxID=1081669 RepID=A0A1X0Q9S1_9MICR|nr:hypothetical protein HERIO_1519 [Hepatospora eriocheir]